MWYIRLSSYIFIRQFLTESEVLVLDLYSSWYIQRVLISSDSELPIACCAVEKKKKPKAYTSSLFYLQLDP